MNVIPLVIGNLYLNLRIEFPDLLKLISHIPQYPIIEYFPPVFGRKDDVVIAAVYRIRLLLISHTPSILQQEDAGSYSSTSLRW